MTSLMILLAIAALASIVQTVRAIGTDGYGTRPGPRSHLLDEFQTRRPLRHG